MVERDGEMDAQFVAALLRELLQALLREREAVLSFNEPLLAETLETSRRLLEELQERFNPSALPDIQREEFLRLLEQARRLKEQNHQLLKEAASTLEGEMQQLCRGRQALRSYQDHGAAALFLCRNC